MSRWWIYLRERSPFAVNAALCGGVSASGVLLATGSFAILPMVLSFVGQMVFLTLLRLTDELKDYDKDIVAHPDRPIPRGLISRPEAQRMIYVIFAFMIAYAVVIGLATQPTAGLFFVALTGYLYLMYREFFVPDWLNETPIWYAITHQAVFIPFSVLPGVAARPEALREPISWFFGVCVVGAFFTFELCRKLDPKSNPILKTYLVFYGRAATSAFAVTSSLVAAYGAWRLGLNIFLWPIEALVVLSLPILFVRPERFKIVETLSVLSFAAHAWSIVIAKLTHL